MKLKNSEVFHILCLDAPTQSALRYCLYNLAQQKFTQYMDFISRKPEFPLEKLGVNIMEIFAQYDKVTTLLAPFQGEGTFKGKTKFLQFKPSFFKHIVEAVNRYSLTTAELVVGKDTAKRIDNEMEDLTELVQHSMLFTYTQEEIKKVSQ